MPLSILFWVLFILWIILSVYWNRTDHWRVGSYLLLAVLIFLLGWRSFGFILQGG